MVAISRAHVAATMYRTSFCDRVRGMASPVKLQRHLDLARRVRGGEREWRGRIARNTHECRRQFAAANRSNHVVDLGEIGLIQKIEGFRNEFEPDTPGQRNG